MRIITVIAVLTFFVFQACNASQGIQKRANDDAAILSVKKIRDAQMEFEKRRGKGSYGSLDDLVKENIISSDFADGVEQGYRFILKVGDGKYALQAIPVEYGTENSQGNFSLYLDESKIIRSATKKGINTPTWEIAGPESIPIKEQ